MGKYLRFNTHSLFQLQAEWYMHQVGLQFQCHMFSPIGTFNMQKHRHVQSCKGAEASGLVKSVLHHERDYMTQLNSIISARNSMTDFLHKSVRSREFRQKLRTTARTVGLRRSSSWGKGFKIMGLHLSNTLPDSWYWSTPLVPGWLVSGKREKKAPNAKVAKT